MFSPRNLNLFGSAIILASVISTTALCNSQTAKDSEEVSSLLSDVRAEAIQLTHDADELNSFTRKPLSWQSHAGRVEEIKKHTNAAGQLLSKIERVRADASPWQQEALDHTTPLLKEMANSVEATISHLSQTPARLQSGPYRDYVAATYDFAAKLEKLIIDYLDYGKSKAKAEELADRLAVPGHDDD